MVSLKIRLRLELRVRSIRLVVNTKYSAELIQEAVLVGFTSSLAIICL